MKKLLGRYIKYYTANEKIGEKTEPDKSKTADVENGEIEKREMTA
jgi:hypothetical protein